MMMMAAAAAPSDPKRQKVEDAESSSSESASEDAESSPSESDEEPGPHGWAVAIHGTCVVSGTDSGDIRVWEDITRADPSIQWKAHEGQVYEVGIMDDYNIVSWGGEGGVQSTVKVWNKKGDLLYILKEGYLGGISVDGTRVAISHPIKEDTYPLQVSVWKSIADSAQEWEHLRTVEGLELMALGGNRIATAESRGQYVSNTLKVWDITAGELLETLLSPEGEGSQDILYPDFECLAMDEKTLVLGSDDGTAKVWRMGRRGSDIWPVGELQHSGLTSVAVDGRTVVTASMDGTVKVWRIRWGGLHLLQVLDGHIDGVECVAVDGTRVVSAGKDGRIRISNYEILNP